MKILKVTEIRQNLQDVIDSVYYTETPVLIARRNKLRAVIMPLPKDDKKIDAAIKEYEKTTNKVIKK